MVNKFFDVRTVNLYGENDEKYFNKVVKNEIYLSINDIVISICDYVLPYYLFAIINNSGGI